MLFCKHQRGCFTLIELVVAIAIIALVSTMAVSAFRGESPARTLDRVHVEFNSFCSGARYRASEDGQPWGVYYNQETKVFTAQRVLSAEEREERENQGDAAFALYDENGRGKNVRLTFSPDKRCEFSAAALGNMALENESVAEEDDNLQKLRDLEEEERVEFEYEPKDTTPDSDEDELGQKVLIFYPDGSIGGSNRIVIKCGEISKILELSLLTGSLNEVQQETAKN